MASDGSDGQLARLSRLISPETVALSNCDGGIFADWTHVSGKWTDQRMKKEANLGPWTLHHGPKTNRLGLGWDFCFAFWYLSTKGGLKRQALLYEDKWVLRVRWLIFCHVVLCFCPFVLLFIWLLLMFPYDETAWKLPTIRSINVDSEIQRLANKKKIVQILLLLPSIDKSIG